MSTQPEPPGMSNELTGISSAEEASLLVKTCSNQAGIDPFADEVLEFFAELSQRLLRDELVSRRFPDAVAFGYWIRRANLEQLQNRFEEKERLERGIRVPRGLAFHVAPGNVEALFAYSWAVATLSGCSSIVKLSSRRSELSDLLVRVILETAEGYPDLRGRWRFIHYARERRDLTEILTSTADVLAFWGGDQAINELRANPASPAAHVVTFPDRESLLLLRATEYAELDPDRRDALAREAANDVFTFGQAACSSPRYVVWVEDDGEDLRELSDDLYERIGQHDQLLADITPTEIMAKRTYMYELAARGELDEAAWPDPQWLIVRASNGLGTIREVGHPTVGTMVEARASRLEEVTELLRDSDQTITYFGFDRDELTEWVRGSRGPWPKRIVPIGQAVDFDARWDGMDLLSEFTSLTTID